MVLGSYRCDACEEYGSTFKKYYHVSGWNCYVCSKCSSSAWATFKNLDGDHQVDFYTMCTAFPEYITNKVYETKRLRKRKYELEEDDELVSALANLSIKRRRAN